MRDVVFSSRPFQRFLQSLRSSEAAAAAIVFMAVVGLMFPSLSGNDGDIDAVANAYSYAILALGLNIVVGFAGLLDLGYAAFFAIGAYAYGILTSWQLLPPWTPFWEPFAWLGLVQHLQRDGTDVVHFTVSFWLMLPGAAVIAAFFGVLFGAPTLRLRGDYLAIVTLGFGEIVPIVARNTPTLTNGAMGLNGVAAPSIAGVSFGIDATPYYFVGILLLGFLIFASIRLRDSKIGRAWMAIREDEVAAGAMGINRTKLKLLAFAIGAGFAGMTGTLYVAKLQTAAPGDVRVPGLGDDPGDGRVRRHGQRLGRRRRRHRAEPAAILVAAGSHRHRAPDRRPGRQRLPAACRTGSMDGADLRHHPGADDAVSPQRTDPGDARAAGADLRAAERGDTAQELQRTHRPRRRAAHRCADPGNPGRHGALRRPGGAEGGGHRRAAGRRAGGDRAERLGQEHAVQRHHRPDRRRKRPHPVRGQNGHHGPAAARGAPAGHRAHLPEHSLVPQPDGDGERAGRPAFPAADRPDRCRSASRKVRSPRSARRANG